MIPRKLDVMFAFFSYGGNGGIASEVPDLRAWYARTLLSITKDNRIGEVYKSEQADTPITMTRNMAVVRARQAKADVLVMVDSDQKPDMYLGQPGVEPFFESSFDFIYSNYDKGPHVVGAPYCGPPPDELVYVFQWRRISSLPELVNDGQFEKFTRNEAAMMRGIQPVGGLPTGLIMFDMRIFDITEPPDLKPNETPKGWFYYEWTDKYACEKASTEDGTATRDMSMIGYAKLGYNPTYCNWDAWAGHWKPYCVPKPRYISVESMSDKFIQAAREGRSSGDEKHIIGELDDASSKFWDAEVGRALQFDPMDHVTPDIDLNELKRLVGCCKKSKSKFKAVEIGSWAGLSALAIESALPEGGSLLCVDTWEGNPSDRLGDLAKSIGPDKAYETFLKNTAGKRITALRLPSNVACDAVKGKFDFIFIDANHDFDSVLNDLECWFPLLKSGGVICGHDYNDQFPGVIKAVNSFFGPNSIQVVGNVWSWNA